MKIPRILNFKRAKNQKDAPIKKDRKAIIQHATQVTLDQYSKTFADLARYDRTEKVGN